VKRKILPDLLLIAVWVVFVFCSNPTIKHDAFLYVSGAQCFSDSGLACTYGREPAYPLMLTPFISMGINLSVWVPFVQNFIFLLSTFAFISTCTRGGALPIHIAWRMAIGVAFVPTFLITMNSAIYTESVSASLILILLSLLIVYVRKFVLPEGSGKHANSTALLILILFCIAVISATLSLIKGSFYYSQILFAVLFLLVVWLNNRSCFSPLSRQGGLLICCTAAIMLPAALATNIWLSNHAAFGAGQKFDRAGYILYGRTETAKKFDFAEDTLPFVAQALSDTACRRIYGSLCNDYGYTAENALGRKGLRDHSDVELFDLGLGAILERPVLQVGFSFFEWLRFVLHHGTTGFAKLNLPFVDSVVHSKPFNLVLKLMNLLLYAMLIYRLRWVDFRSNLTITIVVLYLVSYIAPYGLVSTVVRMIFPVAPLLLILLLEKVPYSKGSG